MSRASPDLLLVDLACSVCSSADGIGPTSAGKRRYDISLIQTEQVRSINSLLYDQKSCKCSVKTRQSVRHHHSCKLKQFYS